jgi:amphi-Trp domain-containing protein
MALIEHSSQEKMGREAAAQRLRDLADELARHNEISFEKEGRRYTVAVPDEVTLTLEVEVGGDENEIEVEITW